MQFLAVEVIRERDGPAIAVGGGALSIPTATRLDSGTFHRETGDLGPTKALCWVWPVTMDFPAP